MSDLELCCLRVIRIEGPIRLHAVAARIGVISVLDECRSLRQAGLIDIVENGKLDVTNQGRLKFSALHRTKKDTLLARLKARAGWMK